MKELLTIRVVNKKDQRRKAMKKAVLLGGAVAATGVGSIFAAKAGKKVFDKMKKELEEKDTEIAKLQEQLAIYEPQEITVSQNQPKAVVQ